MRSIWRGATAGILAVVAAAATFGAARAVAQDGSEIHVTVNGDRIHFPGTRPMMMNGRVLVPLRGVLEHLGATVDWLQASQTVIANRGPIQIQLPIGSHTA